MKPEIKEKWIKALESKYYKHIGHRLKCADDMMCAIGVLCEIHSKETGTKWDKDYFYLGEYIKAPQLVLDWAALKPSDESLIIIANNEFTSDQQRDYSIPVKIIKEL